MNYPEDLEWEQTTVIHCPNSTTCKGMLLQSKFVYKMLCTDCEKFWVPNTIWEEV